MSRQTDDNLVNWNQTNFGDGLVKNAPHEDIPQTAVAGLVNAHSFDTEIQPRLAAWLWADLQPPAWRSSCGDALSNLYMTKVNNVVTCDEAVFNYDSVSCYIAWPTGDGDYYHDEISEYISTTQVRMALSGIDRASDGCYIHGRLNIEKWHKIQRKVVWQFGKRIYTSNYDYASYSECLCVSRRMPSNVISDFDNMDDDGMIGNSNGIFRLNFDQAVGILWRANGPVPTVLLNERHRRKEHSYRYDYLYSMARLSGAGIRDRTTSEVKILQQSGTVELNLSVTPNRDYSTYWTEKPIGNNGSDEKIGSRLRCGRLSDAYKDPNFYRTIVAPGASFKFTHNEYEAEFLVDMSATGTNVQNMHEVASTLQGAINTLFPWIIVKYKDDNYFEFTTGRERNASISYLGAGTNGTNIASILQGTQGDGATINDSWSYTEPLQVGIFTIPQDQDHYEWHWNHYTRWRTTDISVNGATPRTTENGEELAPLQFVWDGDFRVAGAFYASKTNGIVTALVGTFEKADEGTPLKWEDGDTETIIEYLSPKRVRVGTDYYGGSKPLQACAIGGGRVMRASQTGDIITLHNVYTDDHFSNTECDERKTIYWSTGYEVIIKEVISSNQVRVHDSFDREVQGITLDPICRVITDITTDETLRNRMDEKHTGLLNMRYKIAMPNCNILRIAPGIMVTAKRTDSFIYYCDLANNMKYCAGYHLKFEQTIDKIESAIQLIRVAPNYIYIWCSDSYWVIPTNNPDVQTLPEFGEWYTILHADIKDEYLGVVDWGSIEEIDKGTFELICHDMSVRQISNLKYGDDLTYNNLEQDIISKDLKECWNIGASAYGRTLGHIFWRTRKP
ncbi:MAG: hypothetical protein ACWGNI_00120 [Desulfobacterales bacterium]